MKGKEWVDQIMAPLGIFGDLRQPAHIYNRIYEAVGRGNERQGKALVKAIVKALEAVKDKT